MARFRIFLLFSIKRNCIKVSRNILTVFQKTGKREFIGRKPIACVKQLQSTKCRRGE